MENTLDYIVKKFDLNLDQKLPINIPILRDEMACLLNELKFNIGAEVGTWTGEHAKILCENIPDLRLYCIDPWVPYKGFHDYHSQDFQPAYLETQETLKDYNVIFIRKFSMDAVKDFEDKSLDFVYIDANHDFRHVIEDIDSWKNKVKKGGIIFGHDYHKSPHRWKTNQVYYAVQSYAYANRINPWFTLGVENPKLELGNGVKAWMWIC